jgi:tyrosinase
MRVQIDFARQDAMGRVFLTWRPIQATARLVEMPSGQGDTAVRLTSTSNAVGAALAFADRLTHLGTDSIDLTLPADGTPVTFWVGGKFNPPNARTPSPASQAYGDIAVEAREVSGGALTGPGLADQPVMVRVRKDAETLTNAERDRFLSAMAALNGLGTGRFVAFRDMHNEAAYWQIHSNISFLPWHRAYLLDIERELQVDFPEVSLPYWRFDVAGPKLFQPSFIGMSDGERVQFSATNPLRNWVAEGTTRGVKRVNGVGPATVVALRAEAQCMAISEGPNANFPDFAYDPRPDGRPRGIEGNPHGPAHATHGEGSWIYDPTQAQKDPLFYLLHNNVDRLWAKWQWLPAGTGGARSDPADPSSYYSGPALQFGHNRNDTLWPWDGLTSSTTPERPPHAPGGGLADSPMASAPGTQPRVSSMIDYLGAHGGEPLGFAYDDVPFEL